MGERFIRIKKALLDGLTVADLDEDMSRRIEEDEDLSKRAFDGRYDDFRGRWMELTLKPTRASESTPKPRRFVWRPNEPHITRGRGVNELKPVIISLRVTEGTDTERERIYNELLKRHGRQTIKSLGEFDREVYKLGLQHVLEEAKRQSEIL